MQGGENDNKNDILVSTLNLAQCESPLKNSGYTPVVKKQIDVCF